MTQATHARDAATKSRRRTDLRLSRHAAKLQPWGSNEHTEGTGDTRAITRFEVLGKQAG